MNTYLIFYQWYENTVKGIIKADTEEEALLKFAKNCTKLDCNYKLEKKYGYGGSLGNFYYDEEDGIPFEEVFKGFLNGENGGLFEVIKLEDSTEGIITSISHPHEPSTIGFYNGEDEEV